MQKELHNEYENDVADTHKKGVEQKGGQMPLKKPRQADNMQITVLTQQNLKIAWLYPDTNTEIKIQCHSLNIIWSHCI